MERRISEDMQGIVTFPHRRIKIQVSVVLPLLLHFLILLLLHRIPALALLLIFSFDDRADLDTANDILFNLTDSRNHAQWTFLPDHPPFLTRESQSFVPRDLQLLNERCG